MTEPKQGVRLNLAGFAPKPQAKADPTLDNQAIEVGRQHGFTGRAELQKIDGRSLRRKGKEQMNMRLRPETQTAFKLLLTDFEDADACLGELIRVFKLNRGNR